MLTVDEIRPWGGWRPLPLADRDRDGRVTVLDYPTYELPEQPSGHEDGATP